MEVILTHLEYQKEMLIRMMRNMGEDVSDELEAAAGTDAKSRPSGKPARNSRPARSRP